jgi:hypothetical protein
MLARQVLFHLSHASSLLWSGYFGDRVLAFAQAEILLFYAFHCCWDDRCMPPCSAFVRGDGGLTNIFAWASLEP